METRMPGFCITFDRDASGGFDPGLPVLAGEAVENLFGAARPAGRAGAVVLYQTDGWLLGAATMPLTHGLEEAAVQLYQNIFQASRGRHLARIWNYIPKINEPGPAGVENYRIFCRGRSLAFEREYGGGYRALLPSASAVGSKLDALTVAFAACSVRPRHVENPLQVPAYDYPEDYGPRPPSFARATVVPGRAGSTVFISGTSAVRGHDTVAPDCLRPQLECALDNLGEIAHACGLARDLDRGGGSTRHFKVYLRDAAELPLVAAVLPERLLTGADRVSYLWADVCRASLRIEIEASLFGVTAIRA
jgi:enamine deaminase RidA (YjgF/YER057c/UK114 family)